MAKCFGLNLVDWDDTNIETANVSDLLINMICLIKDGKTEKSEKVHTNVFKMSLLRH